MAYSDLKNAFIDKTIAWFMSTPSFVDVMFKEVKGVSFVPIHRYGAGRGELLNKVCIVLGKERGGIYKDKYNFFGGKIEKTDPLSIWELIPLMERVRLVLSTLFDETAEEFGIILDSEKFTKSCISITKHGPSILFWCHIVGINRGTWNTIMSDPKRKTQWKYQEMDAIEHIPVDSVIDRVDLSNYVMELAGKAMLLSRILEGRDSCNFSSFVSTLGIL